MDDPAIVEINEELPCLPHAHWVQTNFVSIYIFFLRWVSAFPRVD